MDPITLHTNSFYGDGRRATLSRSDGRRKKRKLPIKIRKDKKGNFRISLSNKVYILPPRTRPRTLRRFIRAKTGENVTFSRTSASELNPAHVMNRLQETMSRSDRSITGQPYVERIIERKSNNASEIEKALKSIEEAENFQPILSPKKYPPHPSSEYGNYQMKPLGYHDYLQKQTSAVNNALDTISSSKTILDSIYHKGGGKDASLGLSNIQIDNLLKSFPEYLGCIAHDEIPKLLPKIKPRSSGGFVINTDPANKAGSHWQSIYFDARGKGKDSIEFFDSYGDPIDPKLLKDIKLIADKLHSPNYLKFKENRIKYQNDVSSNCGWFAAKFLENRFNGLPWKDATGYDDSKRGEKAIERMKYRFFPQQQTGGNLISGRYYDYWPKQVQKYITPESITSLNIGRYPISSYLTKALDLVSLGGFSALKNKLGYDDLFHLFFIINGKYKLERNHLTSMVPYTRSDKEEQKSVTLPKPITIAEFLNNGAAKIGPNLQRYSADSNNCQRFVLQMLQANNIPSSGVKTFVLQDVKSLFEQLPSFVKTIANKVTDTAHLAEKTYNEITGNGRRK